MEVDAGPGLGSRCKAPWFWWQGAGAHGMGTVLRRENQHQAFWLW